MPAIIRLPAVRQFWVLLFGLAAALLGAPPVAGQSIPGGTFSLVAVHPEAAAYPSYGDSLVGLTPWQGRLYTGYGHWVDFAGIVDFAIRAYEPNTNKLVNTWVTRAEGIWNYRPIGGKLYAPITDPSNGVDYAVGEPWENHDVVVGNRRMFDIATFNGSDLFVVGSADGDAVAWRSTDGGQTWQESIRVREQDALDTETHFSFAMVFGGKMYVQAYGIGHSGAHLASKVFDGMTWTNGPNLLPNFSFKGWKPTPFGGKMVYLSGDPANASAALFTFDGVQAKQVQTTFRVWDFFVSGSYVYVLALDPSAPLWAPVVRRSTDLVTWTDVAVPPSYTRSIAALNGYLYAGATGGRLVKYSQPIRRCRQPSRPMSICRRFEDSALGLKVDRPGP
jgi:hypothetical protein